MKITFLGTNGWYDSPTGSTVCTLLETPGYHIIFDAGSGFAKVADRVNADRLKPAYLFLSHFHLDHIIGLHTLVQLEIPRLTLCGPVGTRKVLETIVNAPFTVPLSALPFEITILELPDDQAGLPFQCIALPLLHESVTLGFRIEIDGKALSYCTDTGYCENGIRLSRRCDLLIAECAYRVGERDPNWPHLNPEDAATMAASAEAKALVLTHFDAGRYKTIQDRQDAEREARKVFPHTTASVDGMIITL
jgi:ribonuclease BN (tRNA processing enzyme)